MCTLTDVTEWTETDRASAFNCSEIGSEDQVFRSVADRTRGSRGPDARDSRRIPPTWRRRVARRRSLAAEAARGRRAAFGATDCRASRRRSRRPPRQGLKSAPGKSPRGRRWVRAPRRAAPRGRLVDSPTVAAAYDVQAPRSGAVSRQVDSSARRAAAADTTTAARPRRRRRRVVLAPRRRARRRSFEPKCPRETGPALVRCRAKNATASLASRARWQWSRGGKGAYSRLARADDIDIARRLNQIQKLFLVPFHCASQYCAALLR